MPKLPEKMKYAAPARARGDAGRRASTIKKRADEEFYDEEFDEFDYERSTKFANRGCLIVFALMGLAVAAVLLWAFLYVTGEIGGKNGTATQAVELDIPPGAGGSIIGGILKDNGLIGNDAIFRFFVRFNGAGGAFTPGRYTLEPNLSYDEILTVLTQPPPPRETITVTFPEGITVERFAQIAEENGLCSAEDFLYEANNGDFSDLEIFTLIDYDPNVYMRAEGYLAPETYKFFVDDTPYNIVYTFYQHLNTVVEGMTFTTAQGEVDFYERLEQLGISFTEAMTLASIIEEEASGYPGEMAKVSGVFWNRLRLEEGSALPRTMGTDVSVRYLADWVSHAYGHSAADFEGMTIEDMKVALKEIIPPEVYYTYYTGDDDENTRPGLPGGPMSSPSTAAIRAALQPAQHDYYYFLTTKLGHFYYAQTYSQHQRNIGTMYAEDAQAAAEAGDAGEGDG